jgi:hypothetical protein
MKKTVDKILISSDFTEVLPLYPPPKGESSPFQFFHRQLNLNRPFGSGCSGKKIEDFFYSPFGGGVRGRKFKILILNHNIPKN